MKTSKSLMVFVLCCLFTFSVIFLLTIRLWMTGRLIEILLIGSISIIISAIFFLSTKKDLKVHSVLTFLIFWTVLLIQKGGICIIEDISKIYSGRLIEQIELHRFAKGKYPRSLDQLEMKDLKIYTPLPYEYFRHDYHSYTFKLRTFYQEYLVFSGDGTWFRDD